jgi:hypothetical protein
MNNRAYAALRRLTTVAYFPVYLLTMCFLLPTSVFTWIITGLDLEDQMDWLENKNADYWEWVKQ